MKFSRNSKTVSDINSMYKKGNLYADYSYQRRRVWSDQDNVRLIETILLDLVMPEVFFWINNIDSDTGMTTTHIVDGQQRIAAIVDFIDGRYSLNRKYLIDKSIKEKHGNLFFSDLDDDSKRQIWQYEVSIVNIDPKCTISDIQTMFYRLNLTNYSLNDQEKRNSKNSSFGDKSIALSNNTFWDKARVFSSSDAKRMRDVEFCCSIFILANEGIINQTDGKRINDYYEDYADSFDTDDGLNNKIERAMDIIDNCIDKSTIQFVSKKAQMYTLFSILFKAFDKEDDCTHFFPRLKAFIVAYSLFRNEYVPNYDSSSRKGIIYDRLKQYKLASSEGINKVTNRMIRFEILYKTCFGDDCTELLVDIANDFSIYLDRERSTKDELDTSDIVDESELGLFL